MNASPHQEPPAERRLQAAANVCQGDRPLPHEGGVPVPSSNVTARPRFSLATRCDDSDIRRLLRDNLMRGTISLSLEREPDYFADANIPGDQKQTIVARKDFRVVCVGSCTTHHRFVNGQPRRVGYLGGLRLDSSVAGRFDILRHGYEFFRELQATTPADFYFTSIAADNIRARRFLERGLRGMPRYEFVGEFVTVLIPVPRSSRSEEAHSNTRISQSLLTSAATCETLNAHNQQYQFAPHWSVEQLRSLAPLGLRDDDFYFCQESHGTATVSALWDQRRFKQTVIRSYAPWLALLRPAINLLARIMGHPRLPAVGAMLSNAFVLHLATSADNCGTLIKGLRTIARRGRIELLTLGFAANDPRLVTIRKHFRCREYRSRLYVVRWPTIGGAARELDGRILAPEAALL